MSDILNKSTDKAKNVDTSCLWRQAISGRALNAARVSSDASQKSANVPYEYNVYKSPISDTRYEGQWDELGMAGTGKYIFKNGTVYIGEMAESLFDGKGKLHFPNGAYINGTWSKGKLQTYKLFFADGLEYSNVNWAYCKQPDRRFHYELINGLQPAGKSILTNGQPTRNILMGHYDTIDGFYDPRRRIILDPEDPSRIIRMPRDHNWIINNCRKGWDEPAGSRPDLFESWWPN